MRTLVINLVVLIARTISCLSIVQTAIGSYEILTGHSVVLVPAPYAFGPSGVCKPLLRMMIEHVSDVLIEVEGVDVLSLHLLD